VCINKGDIVEEKKERFISVESRDPKEILHKLLEHFVFGNVLTTRQRDDLLSQAISDIDGVLNIVEGFMSQHKLADNSTIAIKSYVAKLKAILQLDGWVEAGKIPTVTRDFVLQKYEFRPLEAGDALKDVERSIENDEKARKAHRSLRKKNPAVSTEEVPAE
jgi:hypothetical protein